MAEPNCAVCEKPVSEDQDSTELVCNAQGQTICHHSIVHDKCWERFKKQFIRGRAGNRTANVFFCPVAGCHNSLHGQHTAVRQVENKVERKTMNEGDAGNGHGSGNPERKELTEGERRKRDAALGLLEEVEDFEGRCQFPKTDGTFCGRTIINDDYQCCRLHLEVAKKKRIMELALSDENSEEKKRLERARLEEEEKNGLLAQQGTRVRERGIGIEIGDKAPAAPAPPTQAPKEAEGEEGSPVADIQMAPVKVAAWAAAKSGINQQKARQMTEAFIDPELLEDCPICLEVKAIIQLKPCNHAACDKCIDNWMMNRTSFAQTLRNGCAVTTCPLCRASVEDTVALAASAMPAEDEVAEYDAASAAALAKQRQEEIIRHARATQEALRSGQAPPPPLGPPSLGPTIGTPAQPLTAQPPISSSASNPSKAPGAPLNPSMGTLPLRHPPRALSFGAEGPGSLFGAGPVGGLESLEGMDGRGGGAGDLFNRGERTSNTSDAGGEKNVQAMEARLSAMLKDDDDAEVLQVVGKGFSLGASLDDGRPSAAGQPGSASPPPASQPAAHSNEPTSPGGAWESVGTKGKVKGGPLVSDAETERRKKEAEEARKHAEWMKMQMKKEMEDAMNGTGEVGASRSSSQAASDASTAAASPGNLTPPEDGTCKASPTSNGGADAAIGWNAMSASGLNPAASAFAFGGNGFGGAFSPSVASAGGGGWGAPPVTSSASAGAPRASYAPAPPPPAPTPTQDAAQSPASGPRPQGLDRESLMRTERTLRTELGTLREQLQAKEAQGKALATAAARTAEAEERVVGFCEICQNPTPISM